MKLTASKLDLAVACPAAFSLEWRDDPTPDSESGKANHAEYERRIKAGDYPEALTSTWPFITKWHPEVKWALNITSGEARVLGAGSNRDYSKAVAGELVGTCDVYGVDESTLYVVDFKLRNFTHIDENLQLRANATALARIEKCERAVIAIFPEVGKPQQATLEDLDFDAFMSQLRDIDANLIEYGRYLRQSPSCLREGDHCRYCPAFLSCPMKQSLAMTVQTGAASNRVELLSLNNDETAEDAWEFLANLKMLTKRLEARCRARIAERPIKLRSGKYLGVVESQGNRVLDGRKVRDIVRGKYGEAVADACVELETSQKLIKEQFAAHLPRGQVTGAMEKLLAELESAGGVTRKKSTDIMEVDDVRKCKTVQRIANEDIVPALEASLAGGKR